MGEHPRSSEDYLAQITNQLETIKDNLAEVIASQRIELRWYTISFSTYLSHGVTSREGRLHSRHMCGPKNSAGTGCYSTPHRSGFHGCSGHPSGCHHSGFEIDLRAYDAADARTQAEVLFAEERGSNSTNGQHPRITLTEIRPCAKPPEDE